jgi:hypothetical protein
MSTGEERQGKALDNAKVLKMGPNNMVKGISPGREGPPSQVMQKRRKEIAEGSPATQTLPQSISVRF